MFGGEPSDEEDRVYLLIPHLATGGVFPCAPATHVLLAQGARHQLQRTVGEQGIELLRGGTASDQLFRVSILGESSVDHAFDADKGDG